MIYQDGNYTGAASLVVQIDGLEFAYGSVTAQHLTVGMSKVRTFEFSSMMMPARQRTGERYNAAPSLLSFDLTQSGSGGGTIRYSVTIVVPSAQSIPEPGALPMLGIGFTGLSLVTPPPRLRAIRGHC